MLQMQVAKCKRQNYFFIGWFDSEIHNKNYQPGLLNFTDFSVNSQPIFMTYHTHYFPFMSSLP